MKAILIANYLQVYKLHLINNNLEDDSNTIHIQDLIDYVDNQIDPEDREWYGAMINSGDDVKEAKEILEKKGYYTENLRCVDDVKYKFKCTDEQAQEVLSGALQNDATMEQIWLAIDFHGENDGLERITEE